MNPSMGVVLMLLGSIVCLAVVVRLAGQEIWQACERRRRGLHRRLMRVERTARRVRQRARDQVRDAFFPTEASLSSGSPCDEPGNAAGGRDQDRTFASALRKVGRGLLGGLRSLRARPTPRNTMSAAIQRYVCALEMGLFGIGSAAAEGLLFAATFPEYLPVGLLEGLASPGIFMALSVVGGVFVWGTLMFDQLGYSRAHLFEGRGMVLLSLVMIGASVWIAVDAARTRGLIGAVHAQAIDQAVAIQAAAQLKLRIMVLVAIFVAFTAAVGILALKEWISMTAVLLAGGATIVATSVWTQLARVWIGILLLPVRTLTMFLSIAGRLPSETDSAGTGRLHLVRDRDANLPPPAVPSGERR